MVDTRARRTPERHDHGEEAPGAGKDIRGCPIWASAAARAQCCCGGAPSRGASVASAVCVDEGYAFEEIVIGSKTIRLSRWPFTRLFADPAKFCQEKSSTEKDMSPSLTGEAM
ncbi:hypothetical protein Zm00014a_016197 [Zea mays]|uniref:Uncharacterized protein n=1 Tax=Zea mays TaxID=4577 RepID=A0A317YFW4_MAIZE|nr:hypothetical protein Zm00014a_016197 [Zea mays]